MPTEKEYYAEQISRLLRKHIGRHGVSVNYIADALGTTASLVYKHLDGKCIPNGVDLVLYLQHLPESFGIEFNHLCNLAGAHRPERMEGCIVRATAQTQKVTANFSLVVATALEDLKIDHRERKTLPCEMATTAAHLSRVAYGYREGLK